MRTLMAVVCNAVAGRDDEMNEWYTWVHVRDVMKLPGSIAVQRWALAALQPRGAKPFKYLALYELSDQDACTKGHAAKVFTPEMPISSAFDFNSFHEAYYDPVDNGSTAEFAAPAGEAPVLFARMNAVEGEAGALETFFTGGALSQIACLPGVRAAHLFRYGHDQIFAGASPYSHVLVGQLCAVHAAVPAWDAFVSGLSSAQQPVAWDRAEIAVYEPIMPRLTAAEVLHPSAEAQARSDRARAALGDRVHTAEVLAASASVSPDFMPGVPRS